MNKEELERLQLPPLDEIIKQAGFLANDVSTDKKSSARQSYAQLPVVTEAFCNIKGDYSRGNRSIQIIAKRIEGHTLLDVICPFFEADNEAYCNRMYRTCPFSKPSKK